MGMLKPNATYVYEYADGVTYAREFGDDPSNRFEIGRTYERFLKDELHLWEEIVRAGRQNTALHEALERAKLIYELSKKDHGKE